jgi:DNA repair ATPase RecN
LEQRVAEITKRQVENGVKGHGRALVVKLEETADSTVSSLKSFIKRTVESLPEDATEQDLEAAHEKCSAKTRELGLSVKERAQDVRAWKANYDQETDSLVQAAVRSTVEVLEKIHGLGLQEVGMRWAWLDGVTYQDWQNYHKLRNTLEEWQAEVEAVGSRHDGLRVAHEEGKKLEDEAMEASARMVSELIRLKDVAKWKLWANDATDDFTNKVVPARVFKAAQQASSLSRVRPHLSVRALPHPSNLLLLKPPRPSRLRHRRPLRQQAACLLRYPKLSRVPLLH